MRIRTILSITTSIVRILGSLFALWATFDWKVRRTRKAFEKELVKQGMSKEDARRISAQYKTLKNQLTSTLVNSIRT
ncbi:MAG: hypothetical protein JSV58_07210 [Candidatus Bathyarchaeota archaeon]|nr:MAG: hypothetical protein JSV58_07210 [Candidatus Bathyarchaeota archaeon]